MVGVPPPAKNLLNAPPPTHLEKSPLADSPHQNLIPPPQLNNNFHVKIQ